MKGKYLLYGALALVGVSAFGAKKGFDLADVASQLTATIKTIRNLGGRQNPTTGQLEATARIDVAITNPTTKDLNFATAGAVTISELLIFDKRAHT